MKTTLFSLLASLALAPLVAAQNSVDVEVWAQFSHNYAGSVGCKLFDMAYTADGHLIVAFAEDRPAGSDRLIVAEWDPTTLVWLKLCDQTVGVDDITGMELAVPRIKYSDSLRNQWYVALSLNQPPVSSGNSPQNYVGLFTGKIGKVWAPIARFFQNLPTTVNTSVDVHPTLAVTPTKPGDWKDYAVDVFACWSENAGGTGGTIWRATSVDYGRSFAFDQRVAGLQGTMKRLDGTKIDTGEYGRPSAYGDFNNAFTLLAFEDPARGTVRIATSTIGMTSTFQEIFETKKDGRIEFVPTIVSYGNDVNFTCLTSFNPTLSGSLALTWYVGTPFGLFDELHGLHMNVSTAADIQAYESDAYVTVIAYPDQSGAKSALTWEGDRDDTTITLPSVNVSDAGKAWGPARVAVTPDGTQPFRHSYGWMSFTVGAPKAGVWLDL
ncbi:MAG: hypothetical protein K8S98_16245 [Planctomycetes bacterium]|nr:hypothetical protein [Planctomycetota bacterium]